MKLSNKQKVHYFSKYVLSLGTRSKENMSWSEVSIAAKGYVTEIENYAVTLLDESEDYRDPNDSVDSVAMARSFKEAGRKRYLDATQNQPEQPLEMVELPSNPREFEVGGTFTTPLYTESTILAFDAMDFMWAQRASDEKVFYMNVTDFKEITNYKPPVRVPCWRLKDTGEFTLNKEFAGRHYGEDAVKGEWRPT